MRSKGFTFIEILVAMVILALGYGLAMMSFGQLTDRDLDNQAASIRDWMQSLSDRSVLEGGTYGFRVLGDQLQAVSWFDHQWHLVVHEGSLQLPANISFALEEDEALAGFISEEDAAEILENQLQSETLGGFALDDDVLVEPLMVFMPSGEPLTEGELLLLSDSGSVLAVSWDLEGVVDDAEAINSEI